MDGAALVLDESCSHAEPLSSRSRSRSPPTPPSPHPFPDDPRRNERTAPSAGRATPARRCGTITLAGDERSPRERPSFRVMAATKYEFRIRGRLSEPLLARFEMLESEVERVETVLHGPIRDQAELHGIIDRVQSLGLELIEVRRLPD